MPSHPGIFADIHCHTSFKPYGQSFTDGNARPDPTPDDKVSLWYSSVLSDLDTKLSASFDVAMYTQSHLAAVAQGGAQVICISLGGLEKEFITISRPIPEKLHKGLKALTLGKVDLQNFLLNLVTRFGVQRMNLVRSSNTYFDDLEKEIAFIQNQSGKTFKAKPRGPFYSFKVVKSGQEMAEILATNAAPGAGKTADKPITICLVFTMEGLHNLDAGNGADEATVMAHVRQLKSDPAAPFFFVTFCHHFWNGLCGHAESLPSLLSAVFDQTRYMGDGFHPIGLKVLMALLDSTKGRRILIDIKHLSFKARSQYLSLLAGEIPDDLEMDKPLAAEVRKFFRFNKKALPGSDLASPPVIVSHAAVNGYRHPDDKRYYGNYPARVAGGVMNPFENAALYPEPGINFYDTDLISVARFDCLVGIQLDEHRIAGPAGLKSAKSEGDKSHAYLVWNQILHMVELWDTLNVPNAWGRICIGSDFDGIIAPLEGLHRASDLPALREGLLHYCALYFLSAADFAKQYPKMGERGVIANQYQRSDRNGSGYRLNPEGLNSLQKTGLTPEQIVDRICAGNALDFIQMYFK